MQCVMRVTYIVVSKTVDRLSLHVTYREAMVLCVQGSGLHRSLLHHLSRAWKDRLISVQDRCKCLRVSQGLPLNDAIPVPFRSRSWSSLGRALVPPPAGFPVDDSSAAPMSSIGEGVASKSPRALTLRFRRRRHDPGSGRFRGAGDRTLNAGIPHLLPVRHRVRW